MVEIGPLEVVQLTSPVINLPSIPSAFIINRFHVLSVASEDALKGPYWRI